jgi:hypothetical protein
VSIFSDLQQREPTMFATLLAAMRPVASIKAEAGQLNLRYERNDPEAVKACLLLSLCCLCGSLSVYLSISLSRLVGGPWC